ncbi:MAG: DUF502 domain-containing protein [Elusimicrobia bacterium]|nr:DUF502 domain-containing protein [Elusimicrobiota bacterium]
MFGRLKKYFFSGLAVFLPVALTLYVCIWILNFAEGIFGRYLKAFFIQNYDFYVWGLGIVVLVSLVLLIGFIVANYFGRSFHLIAERILLRIPVMGTIYPAFKEISKFLLEERPALAGQVVLIEWPRKGVRTVAFLTNTTDRRISDRIGTDMINVLVPTVPNPLSGFIAIVPREEVIFLDITIEEALKVVVSGGVVNPWKEADAKATSA